MIKSYFKTALRFLFKNKTFSLINIFGLTLGTLCFLYIVLYIADQYGYDRQHAAVERIFRIDRHTQSKADGYEGDAPSTTACVAPLMKKDFPEVEQFTRVVPFLGVEKQLLRFKDKILYEKDAVYVDSTFFEVFNFHFVAGNPSTALAAPYSVVLLKPTADRLFGKQDPIGKSISIDNVYDKHDYVIKGVIDERLGKSHIQANIFITMNSGNIGEYMLHADSWVTNSYVGSYVKLRPNTHTAQLEKKLPAMVEKYGGQELRNAGRQMQLYLQPVRSIHTTTGLDGYQLTKPVSPSFLTILLLIAMLIQLVACINFMNLSTARASKRAKEVGVRKVIGAGRNDLIKQFLGESILLAFIGVLFSLPLLFLMLPYLNEITEANIGYSFLADYRIWLLMFGLIIFTGLFAGSYPAFYLSAFRAIKVLKGNFTNHISATGIRRSLVVFQFVLSIVLISGIIIIYSQLNYIKTKDLGFQKDQRLIVSVYSSGGFDHIPDFVDDVRKLAGVKEASNASKYAGNPALFSNSFFLHGQTDAESKGANFIIADEYFLRANGIKLVSGRDFNANDSAKVLINETFAKHLGLTPTTAIGTLVYDNQSRVEEIVGVIKDFNYGSLHKDVGGFLLWINNKHNGFWPHVIIHTSTSDYKGLLSKIESVWRKNMPGVPFSYGFLDEEVQKQYEAEISLSKIINSFTLMAILISSLGLFGLAAFSAEQRNKEIGIRKVLGASVSGIVQLLSKDFVKLVLLAILLAVPIAWWAMNKWLQAFAYRISISWWMFAMAGLLAILIALLTVSFHAIRAAIVNPVKSLRSE